MTGNPVDATDLSLIERMGDSRFRHDAWKTFVERYVRLFFTWFKEWNVDPFTMDDVLQETMIRVMRDLKGFDRRKDGSFRAWLKALARNSWSQMLEDAERQLSQREVDPLRSRRLANFRSRPAEDSLMLMFDAWATEEMLSLAESRVRQRVDARTWDIYRRLVQKTHSVEEIMEALGVPSNQVYSGLFRVRRMIREEMATIDRLDNSAGTR